MRLYVVEFDVNNAFVFNKPIYYIGEGAEHNINCTAGYGLRTGADTCCRSG